MSKGGVFPCNAGMSAHFSWSFGSGPRAKEMTESNFADELFPELLPQSYGCHHLFISFIIFLWYLQRFLAQQNLILSAVFPNRWKGMTVERIGPNFADGLFPELLPDNWENWTKLCLRDVSEHLVLLRAVFFCYLWEMATERSDKTCASEMLSKFDHSFGRGCDCWCYCYCCHWLQLLVTVLVNVLGVLELMLELKIGTHTDSHQRTAKDRTKHPSVSCMTILLMCIGLLCRVIHVSYACGMIQYHSCLCGNSKQIYGIVKRVYLLHDPYMDVSYASTQVLTR